MTFIASVQIISITNKFYDLLKNELKNTVFIPLTNE